MTIKLKSLSVFLPVYNEGGNLSRVAEQILSVLPEVSEEYELIIVNDGSRDETSHVAGSLAAENDRVKIVAHTQNRGYGAALRSGFAASRYEWVSFIDADGQFDFSEIRLLIQKQKQTGADLVVGFYLRRAVPWYRRFNSFLWQSLILLLFSLQIKDIDCGFKLMRKKVIEAVSPLASERGAFISTELLVKARSRGFKIVEVGVHHRPRHAGTATGARLDVVLKSFFDLLRLWRKIR